MKHSNSIWVLLLTNPFSFISSLPQTDARIADGNDSSPLLVPDPFHALAEDDLHPITQLKALEIDSYPIVLSVILPQEDASQLTSRFDVIDAMKVGPRPRNESVIANEDISYESPLVKLFLLITNEDRISRLMFTTSQAAIDSTVIEVDHIQTRKLRESAIGDDFLMLEHNSLSDPEEGPFGRRSKSNKGRGSSTGRKAGAQGYTTIDGFSCFRDLSGMTDAMFDLATNNPNLVTVTDIGDSYLKSRDSSEGYDIYAMVITSANSARSSSEKGKFLVTAGHHAREYAPPELAMRFAETLVNGYDVDADTTWILDHTEIHIILYVNPDGRYVAENDREAYKRKNMNPGSGGCKEVDIGTDLNRNYDFMWGDQSGASDDPCDEDYHGTSPNSEPETFAVRQYASTLFPTDQRKDDPEGEVDVAFGEGITGLYVDIHSYGGLTYYPWGYVNEKSPDDDALQALGRKVSSFNGYVLWSGGQPDFLYPATGDASDFMYAEYGVASFGLEIGNDFYQKCKTFEKKVLPDNLPALLYVAKISTLPNSLIKGPDVLNLQVASVPGELRISALVSDSEMVDIKGYAPHPTGGQKISQAKIYLDVHPDDDDGSADSYYMQPVDGAFDSGDEEVESVVSTDSLSDGKHVIFIQAMDSDGYLGPVSSAFFQVGTNANLELKQIV